MTKVTLVARYLLALLLIVFGLNKFMSFMPTPDYSSNPAAASSMGGIAGTQIFPILGVIYLLSAVLLATNKMVGLATVTLAAIAFNILLFHITLDPSGMPAGLVFAILIALTMAGNASKLKPLLS